MEVTKLNQVKHIKVHLYDTGKIRQVKFAEKHLVLFTCLSNRVMSQDARLEGNTHPVLKESFMAPTENFSFHGFFCAL